MTYQNIHTQVYIFYCLCLQTILFQYFPRYMAQFFCGFLTMFETIPISYFPIKLRGVVLILPPPKYHSEIEWMEITPRFPFKRETWQKRLDEPSKKTAHVHCPLRPLAPPPH